MSAQRKHANPVIRISPTTHATLQDLSVKEDRSMGEIVNDLVERYEREQFWGRVREQLARLKADPVAWQDYQDEIALLEGGSMDGLEDEEPYFTQEELEEILASDTRTQGG